MIVAGKPEKDIRQHFFKVNGRAGISGYYQGSKGISKLKRQYQLIKIYLLKELSQYYLLSEDMPRS